MAKAGQRVYLRAAPHNTGTIARVTPVGFTVVFDDPKRKPGHPRSRFSYPADAIFLFEPGRPAPQE